VWLEGGKLEHVAVAKRALGRPLPEGVEVHHVNEVKSDNRGSNLVICPNREYHALLHVRTRALDACGNAAFRQCEYCKKWDAPENLKEQKRGRAGRRHRHSACHAAASVAGNKARLIKNRDRINAAARARYAANPQKQRAATAKWLAKKNTSLSPDGVRA
jgi:hypothetical protein